MIEDLKYKIYLITKHINPEDRKRVYLAESGIFSDKPVLFTEDQAKAVKNVLDIGWKDVYIEEEE